MKQAQEDSPMKDEAGRGGLAADSSTDARGASEKPSRGPGSGKSRSHKTKPYGTRMSETGFEKRSHQEVPERQQFMVEACMRYGVELEEAGRTNIERLSSLQFKIDQALLESCRLLHALQPYMVGRIGLEWGKNGIAPVRWQRVTTRKGSRVWKAERFNKREIGRSVKQKGAFAEYSGQVRDVVNAVKYLLDTRERVTTLISNLSRASWMLNAMNDQRIDTITEEMRSMCDELKKRWASEVHGERSVDGEIRE